MSSFILVRYQSRIEYSISQMSARRKHVRAHARDVEVEVDGENDLVCRVEEIKGGNVIEVLLHINTLLSSLSHRFGVRHYIG